MVNADCLSSSNVGCASILETRWNRQKQHVLKIASFSLDRDLIWPPTTGFDPLYCDWYPCIHILGTDVVRLVSTSWQRAPDRLLIWKGQEFQTKAISSSEHTSTSLYHNSFRSKIGRSAPWQLVQVMAYQFSLLLACVQWVSRHTMAAAV